MVNYSASMLNGQVPDIQFYLLVIFSYTVVSEKSMVSYFDKDFQI